MNKTILISITGFLALAVLFAGYQLLAEYRLQQEQVARYENYVAELQAELETVDEQRVQYETELNRLRRELGSTNSRANALASELEIAQAQIDPEIVLLEQQIREQLMVELQGSQQSNGQSLSRADLFKQLNTLEPDELGTLMAMQSLYGDFLRELDVDDQRMDAIIDGLNNIIAERNQLRMDAIEELRQNPGRSQAQALRQQMLAMSSPDAQLEALSYLLSDEELEIYQRIQEEQRQNGTFQTQTFSVRQGGIPFRTGRLDESSSTMIIQGGQGDAPAIQIFRAEETPQ